MASVWKHPKSPYWTACFTDLDGKRKKRSTKETNRRKAEKLAEQFEVAARKRRTFSQVRSVLQDLHKEITGEELKFLTVREHVMNWLAEKRDETKASSMFFYTSSTTKFLTFLGDRADEDLSLVTRSDLVSYRKHLASKLSSTSTNQHIKCIRMVFKAAKRDGLAAENPAEFVERVKKKGGYERRPFTLHELRKVYDAANAEWKSMILFGLYTGQRLSDIAGLKWSNIDMEGKQVRMIAGKTGRDMRIPMADALYKHLTERVGQFKPDSPLHPKAAATLDKTYKVSTLSNQFANLLASVDLRDRVSHKKDELKAGRAGTKTSAPLSFHSLRHTAVSMLKEANIPSSVVMEFVGHESKHISEHYTHIGDDSLRKAADAMPRLTD